MWLWLVVQAVRVRSETYLAVLRVVVMSWERKWRGDQRQSGLSVATFNILADGWVDGEKHGACFPNILDSSRERLESVLDHLRGRDATVQSRVADSGRTISRAGRFSQK